MKRERLFEGRIVTLELINDRYEIAWHPSAVCVVAQQDGRILGVSQPRLPTGGVTWEIPAGMIDAGEAPEVAAARELREETQRCGQLTLLSRFFTSPGFTDEEIFLYEATDLQPCHGVPDETEELTVEWRDPKEIWDALKTGDVMTSAATVVALRHVLATQGVPLS
jgi:ADP-ribose pyrophosphatase